MSVACLTRARVHLCIGISEASIIVVDPLDDVELWIWGGCANRSLHGFDDFAAEGLIPVRDAIDDRLAVIGWRVG